MIKPTLAEATIEVFSTLLVLSRKMPKGLQMNEMRRNDADVKNKCRYQNVRRVFNGIVFLWRVKII
jgi:hypothetical protein